MTYACPKGHDSTTDDFCDTCGARLDAPPAVVAPPAAAPATTLCPHCGAPQTVDAGRFCEDCGYDHSTGKVPVLDGATPSTTSPDTATWTATIEADPDYFEQNDIDGVTFPVDEPPRTITLPPPQVRIGRRSMSKGTTPEIDLANSDPGVSHSHALLTLTVDGAWLLSDLGSTNGTYLNDEPKPLTSGETRTLKAGDRVHVGAWTTITVHAPA